MQAFPQGLPFVQCFGLEALAPGAVGAAAVAGGAAGSLVFASDGFALTGAAAGVCSLWHTSFFEMQLFPHGFPLLQFRASTFEVPSTIAITQAVTKVIANPITNPLENRLENLRCRKKSRATDRPPQDLNSDEFTFKLRA